MSKIDKKIDKLVKGTGSRFANLERLIYLEVFAYLAESLQSDNGVIRMNPNNMGVIGKIDSLGEKFGGLISKIGKYIISGIRSVIGLSAESLAKIDTRALSKGEDVKDEMIRHTASIIQKDVSLERIFLDIKQEAVSLLASKDGIDLVGLRKALKNKVVGNKLAQRYYSRWTYDLYSQMERVGSNRIRIEIGLKYAIYQGGLIETTRSFCNERNNKCFSEDEINSWNFLNWDGKPQIGYNAIVDLGGYNCRHRLDWISEELAKRLRPDLFV